MKKILMITFSNNADHQDITYSMYNTLLNKADIYYMGIKKQKIDIKNNDHIKLVECPKKPGICRGTFRISKLIGLIDWIKKNKFDIIFFESLHVWNIPIIIFCKKSTNIYHMIHDVIPHKGDKSEKKVYIMNKIICKFSDKLIICNKKYRKDLSMCYNVKDEKIKCTDMTRNFPQYLCKGKKKNVLFFGRINPYKGVDDLIKIIEECSDLQFTIIGRVDIQMKSKVDQLKKFKNVYIKDDYVDNKQMEGAFLNCGCVILPYKSATQSGVIIDSYRFGRPVIAYNVGAVSEQIQDGKSGYLIQQGNITDFVEKINFIASMDDESYENMCYSTYKYGFEKYSSQNAQARVVKLFDIE